MTRHAVRYVLPLVAALSLQLTGCGEDAPGAASPGQTGQRIGLGDFTSSSPSNEVVQPGRPRSGRSSRTSPTALRSPPGPTG